jgi:hypothetical protein
MSRNTHVYMALVCPSLPRASFCVEIEVCGWMFLPKETGGHPFGAMSRESAEALAQAIDSELGVEVEQR